MLIISECRLCNVDKTTCPIKTGLRNKLQQAGIKEPLKYKCNDWRNHLKYKAGDVIEFHFIERSDDYEYNGSRFDLSGETITGTVFDVSKRKPIYHVRIDAENRNKLDSDLASKKYLEMIHEEENWGEVTGMVKSGFFTLPVKEELIIEKVEPCKQH